MNDRDHAIAEKDCTQTKQNYCNKVTANLNIHLEDHVSSKIDYRKLHKDNIHERATTAKTSITNTNMWKNGVIITKLGQLHGAQRWTSTSALTKLITWLEYYQTTEKQISSFNLSLTFARFSDRQHSKRDCSKVVWICSKKIGRYSISGEWW